MRAGRDDHRTGPVVHTLEVEMLFTRLEFSHQFSETSLSLRHIVHDGDVCMAIPPRNTLVDSCHFEAILAHGDHACFLRAHAFEAKSTDLPRLSQHVVWHALYTARRRR